MKGKKSEDRKVLKRAGTARKKRALVRSKRAVPVGKPFQKGPDPRRHKLGRVSLDRATFSAKFNNFLCNGAGDPEELAGILWKYARAGQAWAVSELLDRICGKDPQAMEIEDPVRTIVVKYAHDYDNDKPPLSPTDDNAERTLAMASKTEGTDEH